MLVNKAASFKEDDIIGFKLSTGEEIIGKVAEITDDTIVIDKPCTLGMAQNGQLALSPASYMADMEKPVSYFKAHIVAWFATHGDLESGYRTETGGIQVPPQGLVMPNK
jgi:hypothetical protein